MSRNRFDITNDMIIDLYFNKNYNRRQTAEILKCSLDLIDYRLKKLNMEKKPMCECVFSGKKRNVIISEKLNSILNGEMLGDGGLYRYYKQGSFCETVGYDKKEWAEYLINLFVNNNIPIMGAGIYYRNPTGKSENHSWSFSTKMNVEFGNLHKKWYVENKKFNNKISNSFNNRKYIKMVPLDLKIDSDVFLHWYIGDGSTSSSCNCIIHTEGFSWEEVEYLRFLLKKDMDISSNHYKGNVIYIPRKDREKILNIIGECPVDCYKYKWKFLESKRNFPKINKDFKIDMQAVKKYIEFRENF